MAKGYDKQLDELVLKAKAGEREAFSEIVKMMMNKTLALTYKMTLDTETAMDLAQDTFVSAWQSLKGFKGEAKFESWLYRIATNKCLNYLKRKKNVIQSNEATTLSTLENPEKQLQQKELRLRILSFIAELPTQQRIVFELHFYKELTFKEVARITKKASGTVKTLYREAIIKLRYVAKKEGWYQ